MYQSDNNVMMRNASSTRAVTNVPLYHVTFSGTGGSSCVHGKTYPLPRKIVRSRNTSATGRKATYPSMNRMIGRDQRAVVIRWTATNTTPADESAVKNNQLTWNARHALSGATKSPITKASTPIAPNTRHAVPSAFGSGLE